MEPTTNVFIDQKSQESSSDVPKNAKKTKVFHEKEPETPMKYIDWIDVGNMEKYGPVVAVAPANFCRLLYANPVCLLSTSDVQDKTMSPCINVMTISWLTPTTNDNGGILLSMHATRYSALFIKKNKRFVLSIPTLGMEELVKSIGKSSGAKFTLDENSETFSNKLEKLDIKVCRPGWRAITDTSIPFAPIASTEPEAVSNSVTECIEGFSAQQQRPRSRALPKGYLGKKRKIEEVLGVVNEPLSKSDQLNDFAISSCVAHLVCEVNHCLEPPDDFVQQPGTPGHLTIFAQIKLAFVRDKYWANNNFAPTESNLPPYLTFFGGGNFGYCATRDQLKDDIIDTCTTK